MLIKKEILAEASVLEPGVDVLHTPFSSSVSLDCWKDEGKHYLCSQIFQHSSQGPEISWTSCCNTISTRMKRLEWVIAQGYTKLSGDIPYLGLRDTANFPEERVCLQTGASALLGRDSPITITCAGLNAAPVARSQLISPWWENLHRFLLFHLIVRFVRPPRSLIPTLWRQLRGKEGGSSDSTNLLPPLPVSCNAARSWTRLSSGQQGRQSTAPLASLLSIADGSNN